MVKAICGDCKGIVYVGGAQAYMCAFGGSKALEGTAPLNTKEVEERVEIECENPKQEVAPRAVRIPMKEYIEVGITTVFGNGSVQIPAEIRERLFIRDGDKILWIRKGEREYGFRKVGQVYPFKPQFR